jgi:hypothetical protein
MRVVEKTDDLNQGYICKYEMKTGWKNKKLGMSCRFNCAKLGALREQKRCSDYGDGCGVQLYSWGSEMVLGRCNLLVIDSPHVTPAESPVKVVVA